MLSSIYFPLCMAGYGGYTYWMLIGRARTPSPASTASPCDGESLSVPADLETPASARVVLQEEDVCQLGADAGRGRVVTIRIDPVDGAGIRRVPVTRVRRIRGGCVTDTVELPNPRGDAIPDQVGHAGSQDLDASLVGPRASGPEGTRVGRVRRGLEDMRVEWVKRLGAPISQNPIFPRNPQTSRHGISPLVSDLGIFCPEITPRFRLAKRYSDQTMVQCRAFIAQSRDQSHMAQLLANCRATKRQSPTQSHLAKRMDQMSSNDMQGKCRVPTSTQRQTTAPATVAMH